MNEESWKIEKAGPTEQEAAETTELSEKDLDSVVGGGYNGGNSGSGGVTGRQGMS
jgi:bacteriocin-like protein